MRPVPQVGENLFMCIPPDHQRNDLPSAVSLKDVAGMLSSYPGVNAETKVYIGITDDMGNTVTMPCFAAEKSEGRFVLMAHRTGRPEGPPTPKPKPEPLPEVAKLPEGTKVIVTWRYANGTEGEFGNDIWHGAIVESFGPSDTCFMPRVDGTLREKAPTGYAQPVRWRLAEEARP